jgi:hypothetical protein
MEDVTTIALFAGLGGLFGAGFIVLTRWSGLKARQIFAYGLIATAFVFVALSGRSDSPTVWLGFEMTGVAVFGSAAMLSIIGSPWWLVAGYALHPAWVIVFHYIGTGSEFVPKEYSLANAGFDLTLAAYLAYEILREARSAAASTLEKGPPGKSSNRRAK